MEWRITPDFPDYEISENGDVRRVVANRKCRAGFVYKPRVDWKGYSICLLHCGEITKLRKVHRIVAEAFLGSAPSALHEVAHNDGDKTNNHCSNLRWCLHRENERDKVVHKTLRQGEAVHLSKLTNEKVREIRERFAGGERIRLLSNEMGVTFQNIWCIVHRKTWAHVA